MDNLSPVALPRTARRDPVIRVGGSVALLPLLGARGIDAEAILREVGLSTAVFDDPDNVVPFAVLCRLLKLAAERTGLPDIGLRACLQTGLASLGVLGYLVANCETVGRGLAALEAFLYVHDQGATPAVGRDGTTAIVGYEVLTPDVPGADQITYGALAIAANIMRQLCGPGFRLQGVSIGFAAPADTAHFQSFFGVPVRFDAERSALAFDARWLAAPIPNADPYLRGILAEKIRGDLHYAGETGHDRIRRVVRSLVAGGRFTVADAAAAFGISRRTLARRLGSYGTNFRTVLDDARQVEAQRLQRRSAVPVAEVAARLGYSDTPTFARAFRRRMGTSPREWRRRHAGI